MDAAAVMNRSGNSLYRLFACHWQPAIQQVQLGSREPRCEEHRAAMEDDI